MDVSKEDAGRLVRHFELSWILLIGDVLLVTPSLLGSPLVRYLMQIVSIVFGQDGAVWVSRSPHTIAIFVDHKLLNIISFLWLVSVSYFIHQRMTRPPLNVWNKSRLAQHRLSKQSRLLHLKGVWGTSEVQGQMSFRFRWGDAICRAVTSGTCYWLVTLRSLHWACPCWLTCRSKRPLWTGCLTKAVSWGELS